MKTLKKGKNEFKQMLKFCETFEGQELIDCYDDLSVDVISDTVNFDYRVTNKKISKNRHKQLVFEIFFQLADEKRHYVNINSLLTKKEQEHINFRIDIVSQYNRAKQDESKWINAYYLVFSEIGVEKEYSNNQELINDVINSDVVVIKEYLRIGINEISTMLKKACGLYVKTIWEKYY